MCTVLLPPRVYPIAVDKYVNINISINTGLFISPSGISELDCATTKTDTAERPSGPMDPDGLFVSQGTGSHSYE